MSRVGVLAAAGRSAAAKFHELRLKYWNADLDVVCCFEGSDDIEFFMPNLRSELGLHHERVDFMNCGGKWIVVTLWGWALHKSWNMARLGFFVDRDLDDFLSGNPSGDQLYVSDYYSIESHVLDDDFFDSVWQDFFRLPLIDSRRTIWKSAYYLGAMEFAKAVLPISYMAVAHKRAGKRVDFNRVQLDGLFLISGDGSVGRLRKGRFSNYSAVFPDTAPSSAEIRSARRELILADEKIWLRGKFAIWFAMQFFSRMKSVLSRKTEPNRAVVKTSFSVETSVTCLCGRASVPKSLHDFLRAWAALIVKDGVAPVGATV